MSEPIKFKTDMSQLKEKINFVRNGLGSSRTDLAVMLMRFDVGDTKATIFAAEKEMFCRAEMKITRLEDEETPKPGSFAVLGSKLEKLITMTEAEEVLFTTEDDNLKVQIGFSTLYLELYDGSPLRTIADGVSEHLSLEGPTVPRDALEEAMSCGRSCATSSAINPNFNHVEMRKGHLLSSDGRKIMMYTHEQFGDEIQFKAPTTALSSMLTAVKNMSGAQNVQIIEGKSYYYVKSGLNECTMGVRKVERSFPPLEDHLNINHAPTDEITMDKHVLNSMVNVVVLGLPQDEIKINVEVAGKGSEARLEIAATNNNGKKSWERASCTRKAEKDINFPVSFHHLQDTLGVFKGDSVVDIQIHREKNFMIVKDKTEKREVITVIPFRTENQIALERKEAAAASEAKKKEKEATKPAQAVAAGAETDVNQAVEL